MKRYTIDAMLHVDIEAADAEEAYEKVCDWLDTFEVRDVTIGMVKQEEVPYAVPDGMQRWADAMVNVRLGEEVGARSEGPVEGTYDGSWWWSNGHVLLRCEGPAPTGDDWKHLTEAEIVKAIAPATKRRPTTWGDVVEQGRSHVRVSALDEALGIQQRYHSTIEASLGPGAVWLVGKKTDPMHVVDSEGRLMAVAMGMLVDKPKATEKGCVSDE